jgi:hypothetical protein
VPLLSEILLPNAKSAEAALAHVGAVWDPRLDLDADVDGVRIARRFGVLRNPLVAREAPDARLLDRFRELLELPLNAAHLAKARELEYCPVNKSSLALLADNLLGKRIHLPLTLRPMMLDLAMRITQFERAFPFDAFYARSVQVVPGPKGPDAPRAGATLNAGKLFSIPVSGSSDVTRMEPLDDEELDLRVGLLLEVDAFGG